MEIVLDVVSKSPSETIKIAENFARSLVKSDVILLNGDLGAGKTQFVKGVAKTFKIKNRITSPTFTILNVFFGDPLNLYHLDMYRIENSDELFETGVEDHIENSDGVLAIEWNKYINFKNGRVFEIEIKRIGQRKRQIIISQR